MSRQPHQPAVINVEPGQVPENHTLVAAETDLREITENALKLADQLGYDGALTVGAVEDEIRFYQRRTAEACIELGKRMLILKELTPRGQFLERIGLLGFGKSTAYRFMQSARKFSKLPKLGSLAMQQDSAGKFLELLVLDDDELKELDEEGSVLNISLDDIETMSPSELRTAFRKARDDLAGDLKARNAREAKLNADNHELLKKVIRIEEATPQEDYAMLAADLAKCVYSIQTSLMGLRAGFSKLILKGDEHGIAYTETLTGHVTQLHRELNRVRNEYGLPIEPDKTETELGFEFVEAQLAQEQAARDRTVN